MTLQQLTYALVIAKCKSMNEAAKELFVSQPSLSGSIKNLEKEIGINIFLRTNKGITITPEGEEFLGYARQVSEQFSLLEDKYIEKKSKKKFSVSLQHYSFGVQAFVETLKQVGMDEFEFAVHETKTYEVIENVKTFKSELGILYLSNFNQKVMRKILAENNLQFVELFKTQTYVYLYKEHPLANKQKITMDELAEYPCLSFDQGKNNSFYLAEEMRSTYNYKKLIKANDRATMLNLMIGLNGYTICSGVIVEDLNGDDYIRVLLDKPEVIVIGYVYRKGSIISEIGKLYIEQLKKFEKYAL